MLHHVFLTWFCFVTLVKVVTFYLFEQSNKMIKKNVLFLDLGEGLDHNALVFCPEKPRKAGT